MFLVDDIVVHKNRGLYGTNKQSWKKIGIRFRNCFRMPFEEFQQLLALIEPKIRRHNTQFRLAVLANERLALAFRFLAIGYRICMQVYYQYFRPI
jgi:hypothetical protein